MYVRIRSMQKLNSRNTVNVNIISKGLNYEGMDWKLGQIFVTCIFVFLLLFIKDSFKAKIDLPQFLL